MPDSRVAFARLRCVPPPDGSATWPLDVNVLSSLRPSLVEAASLESVKARVRDGIAPERSASLSDVWRDRYATAYERRLLTLLSWARDAQIDVLVIAPGLLPTGVHAAVTAYSHEFCILLPAATDHDPATECIVIAGGELRSVPLGVQEPLILGVGPTDLHIGDEHVALTVRMAQTDGPAFARAAQGVSLTRVTIDLRDNSVAAGPHASIGHEQSLAIFPSAVEAIGVVTTTEGGSPVAYEQIAIAYDDTFQGEPGPVTRASQFLINVDDADLTLGTLTDALGSQARAAQERDATSVAYALERLIADPSPAARLQYGAALLITAGETDIELVYRALGDLFAILEPISAPPSDTHELTDLRASIAELVRPAYTVGRQQFTRRASSPSDSEAYFFSATLGQYGREDAVGTLPLQLQALELLASSPAEVSLQYVLRTERLSWLDDFVPLFQVFGRYTGSDPAVLKDLEEGLGLFLGMTYARAWDLSPAPFRQSPMTCVDLTPSADVHATVTCDWSALVDYLRTLDRSITVELKVAPVGTDGAPGASEPAHLAFTPIDSTTASAAVGGDINASALSFVRAARDLSSTRRLGLTVALRSDAPLGISVRQTVQSHLFGHAEDGSARQSASPTALSGTPGELLAVFHPPHGEIQGRGLRSARGTQMSMPLGQQVKDGIILGEARAQFGRADRQVDVKLGVAARLQHTYVVGRTGSGKTNLLKVMARQDLAAGHPLVVIDPHGDLVEYLVEHAGSRADDVVLLDFGDPAWTPVINPLSMDVRDRHALGLAIEEFISLLVRQSYHSFYGPRFEDMVRLTLEAATHPSYPFNPASVLDVARILRSRDRRQWVAKTVEDDELRARWQVFDQQGSTEIAEVLHWALSKFSEMSKEGVLSRALAGGDATVSIDDVLATGGVLLVRLPEWEISRSAAALLGGLVLERVRRAVYARAARDGGNAQRSPVFLYVDEFQTFATVGFEEILAEARKFGLALTLAHQNLRQLESFSRFTGSASPLLRETVLSNAGNLIVLQTAGPDQVIFADELGVRRGTVAGIEPFTALCRLHEGGADGVFSLQIADAQGPKVADPTARARIVSRMREANWRSSEECAGLLAAREDELDKAVKGESVAGAGGGSDFLDEWLARRRAESASEDAGEADADETDDDEASGPAGLPTRDEATPREDPSVREGDSLLQRIGRWAQSGRAAVPDDESASHG